VHTYSRTLHIAYYFRFVRTDWYACVLRYCSGCPHSGCACTASVPIYSYFGVAQAAHIQEVPAQPTCLYTSVLLRLSIFRMCLHSQRAYIFRCSSCCLYSGCACTANVPIYFGVAQAAYIQGTDDALFFFQIPVSWLSLPFFRVEFSVFGIFKENS
jgi:hypothetical protein